jgi:hypothetical protein
MSETFRGVQSMMIPVVQGVAVGVVVVGIMVCIYFFVAVSIYATKGCTTPGDSRSMIIKSATILRDEEGEVLETDILGRWHRRTDDNDNVIIARMTVGTDEFYDDNFIARGINRWGCPNVAKVATNRMLKIFVVPIAVEVVAITAAVIWRFVSESWIRAKVNASAAAKAVV